MKRKGFTLLELMGVIIVLAVIALIITPLIGKIIKDVQKSSYRDSVYNLLDAAQLYYVENIINDKGGDTIFHCNGRSCKTEDGEELNIKGDVPISGTITVDKDGKESVEFLDNGEYCADGDRTNLRVEKECLNKDETEPIVDETKLSYTSTTNTITILIPFEFAFDVESGIKSYKVTIDGKTKEVLHTGDDLSVTFTGLKNLSDYDVTIETINRSNLSTTIHIEASTVDFENPDIVLTSQPKTAINGYVNSQVANISYNNSSISNPIYYVKTSKTGISSIGVKEVCGSETEPGECTTLEETTTLEANLWYKVTKNINVTYNKAIDTNETISVVLYDGTNFSSATTATLTKIKEDVHYTVRHYIMNVNGSGYSLNETETLVAKANSSVTPTVKTYTGFTSPVTQTATVAFDESTVINYYYTRNQYTVTVNRGTGISSVSGGGKKYYGSTVSLGASSSAGYHFTGWSGYSSSASFTMPASNVSITANGAANTYYIAYAANGGSGSMGTTTCTYGTTCYLAGLGFSRSGYTFGGWAGSNGGSYSNGQAVSNLTTVHGGTITMTARWNLAQQAYTITSKNDVRHTINTAGYSSIRVDFDLTPDGYGNFSYIRLHSTASSGSDLVEGWSSSSVTYALNGRSVVYLTFGHLARNGETYYPCSYNHTVTITLIP